MLENELLEKIKFLFECDFFSDDFDPDGEEIHSYANNDLIENYDKKDILDCSLDYFY